MDKRTRSPNYPAFSLPDAIQRVTQLYSTLHTHSGTREDIAKGMGYNSLNGASATAISALHKYGLLEKVGDEIKVSERALKILHPHDEAEKQAAIREAAMDPPLFAELAEKFPGKLPTDDLLRNYLIRNGFAPAAVSSVVLSYRETSLFADEQGGPYDSGVTSPVRGPDMVDIPRNTATGPLPQSFVPSSQPNVNQREIGRYNFEGGGFVSIVTGVNTDTEEALEMALTVIELKQKELVRRKQRDTDLLKNTPPLTGKADEDDFLA